MMPKCELDSQSVQNLRWGCEKQKVNLTFRILTVYIHFLDCQEFRKRLSVASVS